MFDILLPLDGEKYRMLERKRTLSPCDHLGQLTLSGLVQKAPNTCTSRCIIVMHRSIGAIALWAWLKAKTFFYPPIESSTS